jgi:hypothetical protein
VVLKTIDHRLVCLRARQRVNSKRYRLRNPKRGIHKAVLRSAVDIERLKVVLAAEGRIGRDATRAEIEVAWAAFTGELLDDLEQGKIYRHR